MSNLRNYDKTRFTRERFGSLLKKYRELSSTRLTQKTIATKLGVSDKTLRNWENDIDLPTAHHLKKIIETYFELGLFTPGKELEEMQELWWVRQQWDKANLFPKFDENLFETLKNSRTHNIVAAPEEENSSNVGMVANGKLDNHSFSKLTQAKRLSSVLEVEEGQSLEIYRHNLPGQLTSFIGRKQEKGELKQLFETTRLLTLSGTGGVGKTRLALELAGKLLHQFEDGVWLVELAHITDPTLVVGEVAHILKIVEDPSQSLSDTLVDRLKNRQVLLLLDNCEHLIENCANLSAKLMEKCQNLKILATSREGLNIRGEKTYQVLPLEVPSADNLNTILNSPQQLIRYDGVQLFVERAQAVNHQFSLNEKNGKAVAEICQKLDGIPLALELAAVRVKSLGAAQIAEKLNDRFHLLTTGHRNDQPRQQTLRAMVDWSYDHLSESEKVLLQSLSVFVGGWTLAGATAVCIESIEAGEGEEWKIFDLLSQLVEKSLVIMEMVEEEEESGLCRYRMLETIREYSKEKCLDNPTRKLMLQIRHYLYCLNLLKEANPKLHGPEQAEWLKILSAEHDNIREALTWSLQTGAIDGLSDQPFFHLAIAARDFWELGFFFSEAKSWYKKGFAHRVNFESDPLVVETLCCYVSYFIFQDNPPPEEVIAMSQQALGKARTIGEERLLGPALLVAGGVQRNLKKYAISRQYLQESELIFQKLNDLPNRARSLYLQAYTGVAETDYSWGLAAFEKALEMYEELGDNWNILNCIMQIGYYNNFICNFSRAYDYLEKGRVIAEKSSYRSLLPLLLSTLGVTARYQKDYPSALEYLYKGLKMMQGSSSSGIFYDGLGISITSANIGCTYLAMKNYAEAKHWLLVGLSGWPSWEFDGGAAWSLENLATLAVETHQAELAAQFFGLAEYLREVSAEGITPSDRPFYETTLAKLNQQIDIKTITSMWSEGRQLLYSEARLLAQKMVIPENLPGISK